MELYFDDLDLMTEGDSDADAGAYPTGLQEEDYYIDITDYDVDAQGFIRHDELSDILGLSVNV